MANYICNRVLCTKETMEKYFLDYTRLVDNQPDKPYVTFDKLMGFDTWDPVNQNLGEYVSTGMGFSYEERPKGLYEIKFCTRWNYPIKPILKALELDHTIEWYVLADCGICVSKFYWEEGVKEDIAWLDDKELYEWRMRNWEFDDELDDCDDAVWYYMMFIIPVWRRWESTDNFERYVDTPAYDIKYPFWNE